MSYFDRLGSAYLERRKVAEKYNSKLKSTNSPSFLGQDFDRSRFSLLRGATPADQQNLHSVSSSTAGLAMRPHDSHPLDTSSQDSVTAANIGDGQSAIVDFVNNKIASLVRAQLIPSEEIEPLRSNAGTESITNRLSRMFNAIERTAAQATTELHQANEVVSQLQSVATESDKRANDVTQRAASLAANVETILENVETRILEARARWDNEAEAGNRRREEDREFMLEQCNHWENLLAGAAGTIENYLQQGDGS